MSTEIILGGSSTIQFQTNGDYSLAGGSSNAAVSGTGPVRFIIPHQQWQEQFSRSGAKAAYESIPGQTSTTDTGQTVVESDGASVKIDAMSLDLSVEGALVEVFVSAEVEVEITLKLTGGNVCPNPLNCRRVTASVQFGLPPIR